MDGEREGHADVVDEAGSEGRSPWGWYRRWVLWVALVILLAVVGGVWFASGLNKALRVVPGVGGLGPIKMHPGDVFATYSGPYASSKDVTLIDAFPEKVENLIVRDVKIIMEERSAREAPRSGWPHDCQPLASPPASGEARSVEGFLLDRDAWFHLLVYFEMVDEGQFSTGSPIRVAYSQGWFTQHQVLEDAGVNVKVDSSRAHAPLPDGLSCSVS